MIQPVADRLRPGLLEEGGVLPRGADGVVSLPALQHLGSAAHDFVDQHTVRVPPRAFPSLSGCREADNIYAAYYEAEPGRRVQPHLDFRALLRRAAAARGGSAGDAEDASDWRKYVSDLAQDKLRELREMGLYAMTLFEVIVLYAVWFSEAADGHEIDVPEEEIVVPEEEIVAPEVEEGAWGSEGDAPSTERTVRDMSASEYGSVSAFLWQVVAVAVGSTAPDFKIQITSFTPEAIYTSRPGDGAGRVVLRELEEVAERYHDVRLSSFCFSGTLLGTDARWM